MKIIDPQGNPMPEGICVSPDHYVQTYTITVRSQYPVDADTIKDIVQTRHEVVDCDTQGDITMVARPFNS